MINYQLAEFSNIAIVVAIVVYMLAFIAFAIDLAQVMNQRQVQRHEAKQAAVGASAGGSPGATGPLTRGSDGTVVTHSGALTFAFVASAIATLIQVAGVIARGVATQRVPWGNMYEFSMAGAAVIMLMYLVLSVKLPDLRQLGLFVLSPALLLMLLAQTFWFLPAAELTPSLQNSHWIVIHVLVAIISTGLFSISFVTSILHIVQARREQRVLRGEQPRFAGVDVILDKLPSSTRLEALTFQINAVGFVLWTFTIIFGAIWANKAWGRYWGWDPKEVWSFVIWVMYAVYLHARATRGFEGTRSAWFSIAGYVCIIFNYTIVNTVINGLHSYSGLD